MTTQPMTRAFVQARMSSRRFPGKVLAPFRGSPLVDHAVAAARAALGDGSVVVLTSDDRSDDPLAAYLESVGVPVFRGPLDDVFERFRLCLDEYPCDWIVRICADSPLLDPALVRAVVDAAADGSWDVVSTTYARARAKGANAEAIRTSTFLAVEQEHLTADDREHVTPFFYRHPERYLIRTIAAGEEPDPAGAAVDTVEDLRRLDRAP